MAYIFDAGEFGQFRSPETLSEIKLGTFVRYMEEVMPTIPEKLKKLLSSKIKKVRQKVAESITDKEYATEFVPYFARYVSCFTDIPYELIMGQEPYARDGFKGMNRNNLEGLFWATYKIFASFEYDQAKAHREFEFLGKTWAFPVDHMKKATVIEYIESAQFQADAKDLAGGTWSKMAYVLAVLFRPKGEVYNWEIIDDRADLISENLGMDIALEGAFFLSKQNSKYALDLGIFSAAKNLGRLKRELKNSRNLLAGI